MSDYITKTTESIAIMEKNRNGLAILGGGPAGLAAGYFARKSGLPLTIFEASSEVGGNCRTIKHGEFLFDTGAHRLHDKYPDLTAEIQNLLGRHLVKLEVPSQIVYHGKYIDFPLSPLDLLKKLGGLTLFKAGIDFLRARFLPAVENPTFEDKVIRQYGYTLAKAFLLDYSQKLWGAEPSKLSPGVSGARLKGLNLKTFVIEAFRGKNSKTEHLDGAFYYPTFGIGMIMDGLGKYCSTDNIRLNSRVTKIFHANNRIQEIEINNSERISVDEVVSSLPLNLFLKILDPAPPAEILSLAEKIRFQHVILLVLMLNRKQITPNASIYFPDDNIPFTRGYEPKNRSAAMSPADKTSFCLEIPCSRESNWWNASQAELTKIAASYLEEVKLIKSGEIFDSTVYKIPFAYPILEMGYEQTVAEINGYLGTFKNLQHSGRSGKFAYTHIHDMMMLGKEVVEQVKQKH